MNSSQKNSNLDYKPLDGLTFQLLEPLRRDDGLEHVMRLTLRKFMMGLFAATLIAVMPSSFAHAEPHRADAMLEAFNKLVHKMDTAHEHSNCCIPSIQHDQCAKCFDVSTIVIQHSTRYNFFEKTFAKAILPSLLFAEFHKFEHFEPPPDGIKAIVPKHRILALFQRVRI